MGQIKKRDKTKTPGLEKNLFSKIKQEYFDIDYIEKLSESEKLWLSQFMEEYLGANVSKDRMQRVYGKDVLHKEDVKRKNCFNMNNARNRDVYSVSRVTGKITFAEDVVEKPQLDRYEMEDELIDFIDLYRDFYFWEDEEEN